MPDAHKMVESHGARRKDTILEESAKLLGDELKIVHAETIVLMGSEVSSHYKKYLILFVLRSMTFRSKKLTTTLANSVIRLDRTI